MAVITTIRFLTIGHNRVFNRGAYRAMQAQVPRVPALSVWHEKRVPVEFLPLSFSLSVLRCVYPRHPFSGESNQAAYHRYPTAKLQKEILLPL